MEVGGRPESGRIEVAERVQIGREEGGGGEEGGRGGDEGGGREQGGGGEQGAAGSVPGSPLQDRRPSGFRVDCILQIHSQSQPALVNRVLVQIVLPDCGKEGVLAENSLPTLLQNGENCHQQEQNSQTQGGKDHSCIAWTLVSGGHNPGWKVWDGSAVFNCSTIY